jgi:hypothetical protein
MPMTETSEVNEKYFCDVVSQSRDKYICRDAIKKITDEEFLIYAGMTHPVIEIRADAVQKIKDQKALIMFAEVGGDYQTRRFAIYGLDSSVSLSLKVLEKIAGKDNDPQIRRIACEQINKDHVRGKNKEEPNYHTCERCGYKDGSLYCEVYGCIDFEWKARGYDASGVEQEEYSCVSCGNTIDWR